MTPLTFTKPLEQITSDDISALIHEKYPENEIVEFKERLPHKKRQAHPWYSGVADIGDRARNEILAEVIAFANARGGHVLLGIRESDEHPRHALAIELIPRCADLAERLKLQMRDCIEPQIPLVHVRGLPLEPDGSGLVIIRVPESGAAPHRLSPTLECYVRRGDRSEKMTMREIQDLTISRARGFQAIEQIIEERREGFRRSLIEIAAADDVLGIRATAVPLTELQVERVYRNAVAFPQLTQFKLSVGIPHKVEAFLPRSYMQDRPILRGAERRQVDADSAIVQAMWNNGLAEIQYYYFAKESERFGLFPCWVLGAVVNTMFMADTFRRTAGNPDAEYMLSIELRARSAAAIPVFAIFNAYPGNLLGAPRSPLLFPLLSIGPQEEFGRILGVAINDLANACGNEGFPGPFQLS